MRQFLCALTAILFLMSSVPAWAENSREQAEEAQLIKDMILYYGWHGDAADEEIKELLSALKDADADKGELWENIMDYWRYTNMDLMHLCSMLMHP